MALGTATAVLVELPRVLERAGSHPVGPRGVRVRASQRTLAIL